MDGWWSHPPHCLLSDSTWLWVIVSGQAAQTMSSLTAQLQALMLLGPVNDIWALKSLPDAKLGQSSLLPSVILPAYWGLRPKTPKC